MRERASEMPSGSDLTDSQALEAYRIDSHRKIQVGSRVSGLCGRCSHAQIIRRRHQNDAEVWCHIFLPARLVGYDIEECSRFKAAGSLDIWELAQLAKVINIEKNPIVGFNPEKTP